MTRDAQALDCHDGSGLRLTGVHDCIVHGARRHDDTNNNDTLRLCHSRPLVQAVSRTLHDAVCDDVIGEAVDVNFGHGKVFYKRLVPHRCYPVAGIYGSNQPPIAHTDAPQIFRRRDTESSSQNLSAGVPVRNLPLGEYRYAREPTYNVCNFAHLSNQNSFASVASSPDVERRSPAILPPTAAAGAAAIRARSA